MTTYSFLDLSAGFFSPVTGPFIFSGGQLGFGEVTVTYDTERTSIDTSADGAIMVNALAGNSGKIMISVQQTSVLNGFLVGWFNSLVTLANGGDVSNWAAASFTLRNTTTFSGHVCTGVAPSKLADRPYAAAGSKLSWTLIAADIQSN